MDAFLHVIYGVAIFGARWEIVVGSVLPDIPYIIAGIKNKLNIKKTKKSKMFVFGERFHSLLFLPIVFLSLYIIFWQEIFIYFLAAVYLHIIADIITHKKFGPRFFWPIVDRYYPRGLGQWEDKKVSIIAYALGFLALALKLFW